MAFNACFQGINRYRSHADALAKTTILYMKSSNSTLEGAFEAVREELTATSGDDPWSTSPYKWLRELQSRTRGKAGEQIIAGWLKSEGFTVGRASSSNSDRSVELTQIEIKLSTQWDSGEFRFQQIRNQDYRFMILLGILPHEVKVWIIPKKVALKHSTPQHTGKTGAETRWLAFDAENPPRWLSRYGGDANRALNAVRRYLPPVKSESENSNNLENSNKKASKTKNKLVTNIAIVGQEVVEKRASQN